MRLLYCFERRYLRSDGYDASAGVRRETAGPSLLKRSEHNIAGQPAVFRFSLWKSTARESGSMIFCNEFFVIRFREENGFFRLSYFYFVTLLLLTAVFQFADHLPNCGPRAEAAETDADMKKFAIHAIYKTLKRRLPVWGAVLL